jgi:hypothetical protein
MYRYSERPMIFRFTFNPADCSVFIITFKQGDIVLEKNKEDLKKNIEEIVEKDGKYVMEMRFTQEESGAFEAREVIYVQATFVINGYRDETTQKKFTLDDVMKDEVVK